jgi:hypothetical protein
MYYDQKLLGNGIYLGDKYVIASDLFIAEM